VTSPADIEALLHRAEASPEAALARQLVQAVIEFHREGLARVLALIEPERLAAAARRDELLGSLLQLHGLGAPEPAPAPAVASAFVPVERLARAEHHARCELCSEPLPASHPHLVERASGALRCGCEACGILFADGVEARFRRVRRALVRLHDLRIDDAAWASLGVPVGLAFFRRRSTTGAVLACFPGPAGTVEAELDPAAWSAISAEHPSLLELEPDVEALLVHRLGGAREHYRASIDECYRLAGAVRQAWRGLSGGPDVAPVVRAFFAETT
jgi:hypothetical protein